MGKQIIKNKTKTISLNKEKVFINISLDNNGKISAKVIDNEIQSSKNK